MIQRMVLFVLLTGILRAAPVQPGQPKLTFDLSPRHGDRLTVELPVSREQAEALEVNPRKLREFTRMARAAYAERQGYSRKTYGPDHWKMVSGVRANRIMLTLATGRVITLLDRERDRIQATDDFDSDEGGEAAPVPDESND
jgi:hypothetical protein